jgi:hypothetical protein
MLPGTTTAAKPPEEPSVAVLPEERVWKRYSPHHELPLSGATSVAIHGFILGCLMLGAVIMVKYARSEEQAPLALSIIDTDDRAPGDGQKPLGPAGRQPLEDSGAESQRPPENSQPRDHAPLKQPQAAPPEIAKELDSQGTSRPIEQGKAPAERFKEIGDAARAGIRLAPDSGGVGKTPGGAGSGTLSQREKRKLRWTMVFSTRDGRDYLKQLESLGAILAIPQPDGSYLVVRDLKHPETAKIEAVDQFKEIYWRDTDPDSLKRLAPVLGLKSLPAEIVAFFPQKLEDDLLTKELKHFKGPEEKIKETHFEVEWRNGKYQPVVVFQSRR